ncbi:MAG: glutamate-5-semialdehyde dehydrogenase [Chthoniobacterales bacterium]|nr:glutamate-5-semialdehyde dehydrogenase [Chthoniobacterales bacterium]
MADNLTEQLHVIGAAARAAARILSVTSAEAKNTALLAMANNLLESSAAILEANTLDLEAGKKNGLSEAMLDRLRLDEKSLGAMATGIRTAASLPDPVGRVLKEWTKENGLAFQKISVPIGVIGIIYESRPNVTSDAAVLCLKAGNAVILRGGSEAIHSNKAIATALQAGAAQAGLPSTAIQLVQVIDREAVRILCEMDQYLDCMIPRGGKGLIETVSRHARMPVIKHYDGICAVYVDQAADLSMARDIILNAKCQRPGVCNAAETLLLHRDIAAAFLNEGAKALLDQGVELRCDKETLDLIPESLKSAHPDLLKEATEVDFRTEFLSLTLAVKIVGSVDEAITHIESHGSHHSDVIVTADQATAEKFLQNVDSATVYWNASTRFTDGGEFGFGCEIGISTDKLHARGPMALEELTSYKYLIRGTGQVR